MEWDSLQAKYPERYERLTDLALHDRLRIWTWVQREEIVDGRTAMEFCERVVGRWCAMRCRRQKVESGPFKNNSAIIPSHKGNLQS